MAFSAPSNVADATVTGGGVQATPQNYVSLGTLIDPTKPDVRDLYVQTYGDQGITGFLELTGAKKNAGTSDKVEWYEEGRLHKTVAYTGLTAATATSNAEVTCSNSLVRLNDVLLLANGNRVIVIGKISTTGVEVLVMDGGAIGTDTAGTAAIIGNAYGQGTDQPTEFFQTGLVKRENPYIITKEMYEVSGSQASNIGWLNVNGQYMWYLKNEMDARKRFMNQREMMLLYSQLDTSGSSPALLDLAGDSDDATLTNVGGSVGSEGYFQAVEERGITVAGAPAAFNGDFDQIILELDKEGAPNEYAMYLDRAQSLAIDDLVATGIGGSLTSGLATQFGAFNNDKDMAVALGFKSFTRGGYTFHKHDWKLLNDPTLGGVGGPNGAMIPMSQVADAQSGVKSPALEMNYKSAGNYSREMEHWVEGGGVLGHVTSGKDTVKFNYRSECNLVTRAANQHVLLQG
jgi:hypothetical protein